MKISREEIILQNLMKILLKKKNFIIYPFINKIDIIAEKDNILCMFETKILDTFVNAKIYDGIGQALRNYLYSNKSYIVIYEKDFEKIPIELLPIFEEFKIGLILCDKDDFEIKFESMEHPIKFDLKLPAIFPIYKFIIESKSTTVYDIKTKFNLKEVHMFLRNLERQKLIEIIRSEKNTVLSEKYLGNPDIIKLIPRGF